MSLQFSECHTKIRHVDAHATLNDGVVVQVMGELSNNGQPMRKFLQTFVLAPEVCKIIIHYMHPCMYLQDEDAYKIICLFFNIKPLIIKNSPCQSKQFSKVWIKFLIHFLWIKIKLLSNIDDFSSKHRTQVKYSKCNKHH